MVKEFRGQEDVGALFGRSKEDYAAMSKLPGIQAHMKAAAALATGFDPVDYDLRAVMLGEGE